MLSRDWEQRKGRYDYLVIGSGYGGAITAARLATAQLNVSVCILERGKEWRVGEFPDRVEEIVEQRCNGVNPLGLYELLDYRDISVMKGSGLGGTSLINANVAIVPDREVFELAGWPASLGYDSLLPYFQRASEALGVSPHPRAADLLKVQDLNRRGQEVGIEAQPLGLTVNFDAEGQNANGVQQRPCTDCGDCISGCNVSAKNTLYMNYLPMASNAGAEIFTQTTVDWIEKLAGGGWRIHGRHFQDKCTSDDFQIEAGNVILAAGSINSTEILLRSREKGLALSPKLGTRFGGNSDFFGLAYNGDYRTNVLGFGTHLDSPAARNAPGPTITGILHYNTDQPVDQRFSIEDLTFPSAYIDSARFGFAVIEGDESYSSDKAAAALRIERDLSPFTPANEDGAMNHTMMFLCMGFDDAGGTMDLDVPWYELPWYKLPWLRLPWFKPGKRVDIHWDQAGRERIFSVINEEVRGHARAEGATFIANPVWHIFDTKHLITAHPLGGCPMGEDFEQGAVDEFGRVFTDDGSIHQGLFVADGALIPTSVGVNPFLTISALAERIAEQIIKQQKTGGLRESTVTAG